ncbi:MAG: poly-gamma-glutamate hydrolase family protein [Acidimicrobiales bacterium]|nr:poly-gamma-glutamate hydrolase family protein [Acidimicrobiales bacterium]
MISKLLDREDVVEELELRSSFGFMAYHGGSLEKATDVIAREAAERSNSSYYGLIQSHEDPIHFASTQLLEEKSGPLELFLNHIQVVTTIHGYGREHLFYSVLLGGRNRQLAEHFAPILREALPSYKFETELENIPKELRGQHLKNPVNYPPLQGVQLELPPTLRWNREEWGWSDIGGIGRAKHVDQFIDALVLGVERWKTLE